MFTMQEQLARERVADLRDEAQRAHARSVWRLTQRADRFARRAEHEARAARQAGFVELCSAQTR